MSSCGNSEEKFLDNEINTVKKVEYSMMITQHLESFPLLNFPLIIDKKYINDSLKNHSKFPLSVGIVSEFALRLGEDDDSQQEKYYINDFIRIATAKNEGKYQEFEKSLDIGMTKDADCHAIGRLEYGDSLGIIIWKISFSSFEACPFYSGTHVLGSFYSKGKLIKTYQLATVDAGSDPPMGFVARKKVYLDANGFMKIDFFSQSMEEEVIIETEKTEKKFFINTKGLISK
jgi:hypothetical protein